MSHRHRSGLGPIRAKVIHRKPGTVDVPFWLMGEIMLLIRHLPAGLLKRLN